MLKIFFYHTEIVHVCTVKNKMLKIFFYHTEIVHVCSAVKKLHGKTFTTNIH